MIATTGWRTRALLLTAAASLAMGGCAIAQETNESAALRARALTQAATSGEVQVGAIVLDERNNANSRVLATTSMGGIESYALDGRRRATTQAGEAVGLGVTYGFEIGGAPSTLLATTDAETNTIRFFTHRAGALTEAGAPVTLDFAAENVCFYRHAADGAHYMFIVGDGGEIDQQLVYVNAEGRVAARPVRRVSVPSPLKQCVADSATATAYASEEGVGVWRFSADPEADVSATLIDSARFGGFEGEVGGLALYDGGEGARWLLASAAEAGHVRVYDRANDDAFVGTFTVAPPREGDAISEPGPLFALSSALGREFPNGALAIVDESGPDIKLISFADIAAALNLNVGAPQDPRTAPPRGPFHPVTATVETAPVPSHGDAADDPAIWAHPTNPALSLVVATNKRAGLYVYDMQGQEVQYLPDGKMNNVDLRNGFRLGGSEATIVAASNRTHRTISLYRLDLQTRQLTNIADGPQPTELNDPYGLCMYRNPESGRTYVFVSGDDTRLRQWELIDAGNGRVRTQFVRELAFASQTEGCVADDDSGMLYIGEEDVALWRVSAAPDGGQTMTAVDRVDANPALRDDIEGASLYDLGGGRGYLIVSSQGNNSYAVYRREGRQEYLGSFVVVASPAAGIDGASETDGLDVTSANLGPGFEHGALVVQDGRNVMPQALQNYKYIPWTAIATALNLEVRR